jgi:two-component system, NtrC family, sensor kinase
MTSAGDIGDHVAVDRAIRRQLNRIIDHAPALIFVLDADRQVTLFNRELAARSGYAAAEVVGKDAVDWLPVRAGEAFGAAFERALAGGSVTGHELTLEGKGGAALRTVFTMARLSDPADAGGLVVAIGQDVTAIKQLEHQVIQAEKLASLGQLAAGVVHEINNPLTSVSVYADFLLKKFRDQSCDPADVNMLERIIEGANRILNFTRDLVDYAKPSMDQFDVVSLNEIATQAISFCEHIIEQAEGDLSTNLAPDLGPIYGVRDQLQQVIINLITNACHALPAAGGEVLIRTHGVTGAVTVDIVDSGVGIGDEALPNIFEPFFTTKPPGEGTGLGLSIVKKIIDYHDGSIMVSSAPGEGTTFSVMLPTGHRSAG